MWLPNVPKTTRADHPTSAVRRVDVRQVAEDTVGYVGADLVLLVREAHQRAMAEDPDQVADRRLEEAAGFVSRFQLWPRYRQVLSDFHFSRPRDSKVKVESPNANLSLSLS